MRRLMVLLCVLLPALAQAKVTGLAYGALSATGGDRATSTAGPLGNGVPGNRLGGLGSALEYVGCRRFLALPDRGPNAVPWNRGLDNTTAYINRVQTLHMTLGPSRPGAAFAFQLHSRLLATTLLWSSTPLVYGNGKDEGAASAVPTGNTPRRFYFTGRSDGFDPAHASNWPADARLDPESLRLAPDGRSFYLGDEYGPHLYRFGRASGRRVGVIKLPAGLAVDHPADTASAEDRANRRGRVGNHGLEGLAISPDGGQLFAAMQGALLQDGGRHGAFARVLRIDRSTGAVREYVYPLDRVGDYAGKPHYAGISEILAINDHALLVDERGGGGAGTGRPARVKRIYRIDLDSARSIPADASGSRELADRAMHKHLFVDLVRLLKRHGLATDAVPEKFEGMSFGPDVRIDGRLRHTLWISTDNDFLDRLPRRGHPRGVVNPNRFLVLGFGGSDLPGWHRRRRAGCPR